MAKTICLWVLSIFLASTKGAPTCEDGWITYKDELCIKTLSDLHTYDNAKEICSSLGDQASLVMVKESELQDLLTNYTHGIFDYIWLGSRYDNELSQFKWEDGDPLTYTNWQEGYPRNTSDPDVCIELRPSEFKLAKSTEGKWAHATCQKRNLVMCQKTLSWSLSDAVNEIIRVRKQHEEDRKLLMEDISQVRGHLEDANTEITKQRNELASVNSRVVPVGSIYIEYYNQPSPQALWPSLSWQDITNTYAGLFFRAYGGGSDNWGTVQGDCSPRITDMQFAWKTGTKYDHQISIPASGWSPYCYAGDNNGDPNSEGLRVHTAFCEVRPKNQAMKIWKRTA